jgi:hypothetical protein
MPIVLCSSSIIFPSSFLPRQCNSLESANGAKQEKAVENARSEIILQGRRIWSILQWQLSSKGTMFTMVRMAEVNNIYDVGQFDNNQSRGHFCEQVQNFLRVTKMPYNSHKRQYYAVVMKPISLHITGPRST